MKEKRRAQNYMVAQQLVGGQPSSISQINLAKTGSEFLKNKDARLYSSKYAKTYLKSSKYRPRLPVQNTGSPDAQVTGASTHFNGHLSGAKWFKGSKSSNGTRLISAASNTPGFMNVLGYNSSL